MAHVVRQDDLLTVSYITGPQHVWLGIAFVPQAAAEPTIVMRPARGTCTHGALDPSQLVPAVLAVAHEYGLHVERIEYVENDSPAYSLYAHCARILAQHAVGERSNPALQPTPQSRRG